MTLSPQRCVFSGILTIWGVLLTYFYFSGRVGAYLHPSFHLWELGSGLLLLGLALALLQLPGADHACADDGCDDTHVARSPLGLAVLAVVLVAPLVVATAVSPNQFGATTILNRGLVSNTASLPGFRSTAGSSAPESFVPKNAAGQIKTEPVDLIYASEEDSMREDFEGKEVVMMGQYMPARGNNPTGDRFSLVKMFIMCCAADARPVAINVQDATRAKIPEMSWVKITGRATFPVEGGRRIPVVVADSVQPCEPPKDSFNYN